MVIGRSLVAGLSLSGAPVLHHRAGLLSPNPGVGWLTYVTAVPRPYAPTRRAMPKASGAR
jgi:hypothetical protein